MTAFNEATAVRPNPKEVLEGLEAFRGKVRSQLALYKAYPADDELRDDERVAMWRSTEGGRPILVKLWKRACWGDQVREGPRILDFLNRLRDQKLAAPFGCAPILDVLWLGDAIVMVQEWVDLKNLAKSLMEDGELWADADRAITFCRSLIELVERLHDRRIAHGDLKPANILIDPDMPSEPILIDLVDFTSIDDGEIVSGAYAPFVGGRFERDCFASTRIVQEMLISSSIDPPWAARIKAAIATVRDSDPANATLLPLKEALNEPEIPAGDEPETISIAARNIEAGPLLADEGFYFLRKSMGRSGFIIRGACEEIEIELDASKQPFRARRRSLGQSRITVLTRHEFAAVQGRISVDDTSRTDLRPLLPLLEDAEARWAEVSGRNEMPAELEDAGESVEDAAEQIGAIELVEDALEEEIAAGAKPDGQVDVATLWERLIEVERELTTEGVALGESFYRRDIRRHIVPFELESGTFEYRRDDRVLVEHLDRRGNWRSLGDLDIQRSKPDLLAIDVSRFAHNASSPMVEDTKRLRFKSHLEETSLHRRNAAVVRITTGQSRTPNLVDVFDPRKRVAPTTLPEITGRDKLAKRYSLNHDQATALSGILATRPLGLLQGPPGTGKTVFISALVHAALTSGLARNILLASQSHEAVNNAAEAVLKVFGNNREAPSIIRVGHEGNVSDRLLPFHAARVERLYKDKFQANMRERLRVASTALGIPRDFADELTFLETAVRPVVARLAEVSADKDLADAQARANGIRETLSAQIETLGLDLFDFDDVAHEHVLDEVVRILAARINHDDRPSPDRIARFRATATLARDFVASVSTEKRSFETFLAGTRQIVVGTCVGLGRASLGLTTTPFDLVIVDEAARCTASELAVPMQAGAWIVLVGDQAQLEPQHDADVVANVSAELRVPKAEVVRSDFERVFESAYGAASGRRITMQYRMLEPIGRLVSSSFYNKKLAHGRDDPIIPPAALPIDLSQPLLWIETDSLGEAAHQRRQEHGHSLVNTAEADCIMALLRRWGEHVGFVNWLRQPSAHGHHIGIICAYAAQRDLIRRRLQRAALTPVFAEAVKIDTIDSYQGKENPIVLLSLVRNNLAGPLQNGVATISPGFMARPNRINVAMSRAMDRLIIVGAHGRWAHEQPMGRVVEAFKVEQSAGTARTIDASELLALPETSRAKRIRENA